MKQYLKSILKGHVKDKKLDEFGVIVIAMLLISMMTNTSKEIEETLKELGVEKSEKI